MLGIYIRSASDLLVVKLLKLPTGEHVTEGQHNLASPRGILDVLIVASCHASLMTACHVLHP